jgi:mono/diheme cytochrome c family protein
MKKFFALASLAVGLTCVAQTSLAATPTYSWIQANIITPKCATCHFHKNFKSYEGVMAEVEAGSPQNSPLYIRTKDGGMPMGKDPLSDEELNAIQTWIANGAQNN